MDSIFLNFFVRFLYGLRIKDYPIIRINRIIDQIDYELKMEQLIDYKKYDSDLYSHLIFIFIINRILYIEVLLKRHIIIQKKNK